MLLLVVCEAAMADHDGYSVIVDVRRHVLTRENVTDTITTVGLHGLVPAIAADRDVTARSFSSGMASVDGAGPGAAPGDRRTASHDRGETIVLKRARSTDVTEPAELAKRFLIDSSTDGTPQRE